MKRKLHGLALLAGFILLGFTQSLTAQISYTANFNAGMNGWDDSYFFQTEDYACNGAGSLFSNIWWLDNYAETYSPSIGTSNGGQVTFTYKYKLLNYDDDSALENDTAWGQIAVYYATSATGPFTLLQTIDNTNHVSSTSCATKTATFYPPAGSNVYLAVAAQLLDDDADIKIIFDQVAVTQADPVACAGTPDAAQTLASATTLCNGADAVLSLSTGYFDTGYTIQWQQSADNTDYTNVATAGNSATYTTDQTASTWYRAVITCTNSNESVNSTPVHIVNTGLDCPCEVTGFEYLEPITYVNFAGIENTSSASTGAYVENYTSLAPAEVTAGQTYDITLRGYTGGDWEDFFTVYFDWNHNGDFTDEGEMYEVGSIENSTGTDGVELTADIEVPETALPGITAMRVFKAYGESNTTPCESGDSFGQVEDYLVNVTAAPAEPELTWVNLQWPATITINPGETATVYAQAYGADITEAAGAAEGVTAWIGVNAENTPPATWEDTVWIPATYNVQSGNNDEYMATIGAGLTPGTYYYASRFQLNEGEYLYGGYTTDGGGFWSGDANISGILTVNCNVEAPAMEPLALCAGTTGGELPTEGGLVWYFGPTGDNAIPEDTVLTDGTFFVAQVDGDCESTRTSVVIDVLDPVVADEMEDVAACDFYNLPEITNGNYYTGPMGTGVSLIAGDQIVITRTVYIYAESEGNAGCYAETSFVITINSLEEITGEHTQDFEVEEGEDMPTLNDLEIEVDEDATVTWYADSGLTQPLDPFSELQDGVTYYAVATLGACQSAPFAVTTGVLGTTGFNKAAFTYYPNPVNDVLNLKYNTNIASVTVINLLGQTVFSKNNINAADAQLNLSALNSGTYLVRVTDDNSATTTVKVVKQ